MEASDALEFFINNKININDIEMVEGRKMKLLQLCIKNNSCRNVEHMKSRKLKNKNIFERV